MRDKKKPGRNEKGKAAAATYAVQNQVQDDSQINPAGRLSGSNIQVGLVSPASPPKRNWTVAGTRRGPEHPIEVHNGTYLIPKMHPCDLNRSNKDKYLPPKKDKAKTARTLFSLIRRGVLVLILMSE